MSASKDKPTAASSSTPMQPSRQRATKAIVTILVPAKNEEAGIGAVLSSLPVRSLTELGYDVEVLVADGRSDDRTRDIAAASGARILLQADGGKGVAVREAVDAARGDIIVMLDADNTYPADDIPAFVLAIEQGYDVVMGSRFLGTIQDGAMTGTNRFGNRALSSLATLLYGKRCTDVCTGMWAFRREAVASLPLKSIRFEIEAELFALSVRRGLRVHEMPIEYRPRAGVTKLGKVRDGASIAWCLLRKRLVDARPEPRRGIGEAQA